MARSGSLLRLVLLPFLALLRVDAVMPIAVAYSVLVHRGVLVEADGFETFGGVAEFVVAGGGSVMGREETSEEVI